jgi:hypothetical protein
MRRGPGPFLPPRFLGITGGHEGPLVLLSQPGLQTISLVAKKKPQRFLLPRRDPRCWIWVPPFGVVEGARDFLPQLGDGVDDAGHGTIASAPRPPLDPGRIGAAGVVARARTRLRARGRACVRARAPYVTRRVERRAGS